MYINLSISYYLSRISSSCVKPSPAARHKLNQVDDRDHNEGNDDDDDNADDDDEWIDMIEQECGGQLPTASTTYVNLLENPERFTGGRCSRIFVHEHQSIDLSY